MQLEKLDKAIVKRVIKKIEAAANNPHVLFKQLIGRPEYKLRVGDYRVIADIDDKAKKLLIRTIGHRKNIYDRI